MSLMAWWQKLPFGLLMHAAILLYHLPDMLHVHFIVDSKMATVHMSVSGCLATSPPVANASLDTLQPRA